MIRPQSRKLRWIVLALLLLACSALSGVPQGVAYWSMQLPYYPPMPFCPFEGLTITQVAPGHFVYDDTGIDYEALWEEWAKQEAQLGTGGGPQMMASFNNNSVYWGAGVYLTNHAAVFTGSNVTASFSIAGGTNFVPYDILTTTNITNSVSEWNWLGIGYTSYSYTFSNQPPDHGFYILAKPQKTTVVGWGNNVVGQCDVPFGLSNAVQIAGGGGQGLSLMSDGTLAAWGQDAFGQGSVPTNLAGVSMVAAGWQYNVALLTNGTVTAWGLNNPFPGAGLTNVPAGLTNISVISAQGLHSLALASNGFVVAWGYGVNGETNVPTDLSNVVAIAAGYQFNLAAKSDGTVRAWGNNDCGQCTVPTGLSNVVDVAAGTFHALALLNDGTVAAWGDNTAGATNVPAGLSNVVAIAASGDPFNSTAYSLALKSDGTVVAWGKSEAVTSLGGMSNVFAISAGADHALAARTGSRTPVITLQPTNRYQIAGGSVSFNARGAGLYGVGYQWQTNGVNLPGATNAVLTLTNVQATHEATYLVVVSNEVGTIASTNVTFTLVTPPAIISQSPMPTNQVVVADHTLTLSVAVSAPGSVNGFPVAYQWKLNGSNLVLGNTSSYTLVGDPASHGTYSVTVTNLAGSTTAYWQVSLTYTGSYIDTNTLCYHLSTNATARTNGFGDIASAQVVLTNWAYAHYTNGSLSLLTNAIWNTNCWLKGAKGLSATCIGFSNGLGGRIPLTMVSPRHYLRAAHVGPTADLIAFLDTNNVLHWRSSLQQVSFDLDTTVGILDADLPASVGYLPVLATNFSVYLPTNASSYVQGVGMNQFMRVFSQPMTFSQIGIVNWSHNSVAPFGLSLEWNVEIIGGDSSTPQRFLIGDQLVLVSQPYGGNFGPNLTAQAGFINDRMHYLSTNNNLGSDYQLTPFNLTNWPAIR